MGFPGLNLWRTGLFFLLIRLYIHCFCLYLQETWWFWIRSGRDQLTPQEGSWSIPHPNDKAIVHQCFALNLYSRLVLSCIT